MASIEPVKSTLGADGKRRAARGSQWRARWRSPDGRSHEKWFPRRQDAENHVASVEHSKRAGTYVDPVAGKVTFRAYAEDWRRAQVQHRPATASQVETYLRRHVYPFLGDRPIANVRPSHVQALVGALTVGDADRKPLAPATVELVYVWVATIFRSAVQDRVVSVSPCDQIKRPAVHDPRPDPLPVETVEKLIGAVPDRYRALIVLGAGTGMRISEALALTNDRVDWMRRTVTVDRQLVGVENGAPTFGPVKDKHNRPRRIPLPQVVVDALSAHVAAFGLGPEGLVFTGPRGGAVRRTTFSNAWMAAAGPLGIPTGDGFHELCHFYASVLIRAGESVKVIQERLGHQSAAMTLDVYGHLWPEDEDRTRAAVDQVLAPREPRTVANG